MEKLFYSIGEVAEMLGENISLVRYWSNNFKRFIKPGRSSKGNRQYTSEDIETLKQIHFLVKEKGMTLEGASKELADRKGSVSKSVRALDCLKEIRAQLVDIKQSL